MGRKVWRTMKPVIRESGGVEDVHCLRLMTLLIELVWEKGNRDAATVWAYISGP